MKSDIWHEIRDDLIEAVGKENFRNWLEAVQMVELDGGIAFFEAPTQFQVDWIKQNFNETILHLLQEIDSSVFRIQFSAAKNSKTSNSAPSNGGDSNEAANQGDGYRRWMRLDPEFTFESFVVGNPNQVAYHAACRVAQNGPIDYNPLFLHGGVGLGKTHLMHAIGWALRSKHPNSSILYLSAEQFMYEFVRALRYKNTMGFKEAFRSVDVLMVDDVQFIAGKDSTQQEFFHTFNALIDQKKRIVLSGDRSPGRIDGLSDRITSRLQSGLVVDLHPTDYELRLNILQYKFERFTNSGGNANVEAGVLDFMARRISSNVRVLEGALNRIFATGYSMKRPITVRDAGILLADFIKASDVKIEIDEIIRLVAAYYNIRVSDLVGAKRERIYARPRHIAMYLAKELTRNSLPEIGRRFGGKDHTTVIYAIKRTEKLIVTESKIDEDVEILRRRIVE
ncbi:MAG: chromosomal replication initiator protein DnaA [Albidovulum sp.]|nr:chromosomal replication initiator protein DnaA [Albidovulum sp.]MDE0532249.1 chromosomal replication initiator protein DnaA [Albidovulum sp.]